MVCLAHERHLLVVEPGDLTSTSASVTGLTGKKAYYWQVRAINGVGTTDANGGAWWSFRTK